MLKLVSHVRYRCKKPHRNSLFPLRKPDNESTACQESLRDVRSTFVGDTACVGNKKRRGKFVRHSCQSQREDISQFTVCSEAFPSGSVETVHVQYGVERYDGIHKAKRAFKRQELAMTRNDLRHCQAELLFELGGRCFSQSMDAKSAGGWRKALFPPGRSLHLLPEWGENKYHPAEGIRRVLLV